MKKHIERQGARISYEVIGEGPALLLGHSLLCDHRMWERVVPELAEHYRVINIDARGHGASTAPAPFSLSDLADDWLTILAEEKITRAALCGLSMGGMTAMRLALRAPERVAALLLLDTSADREEPARRVQYRAMAETIRYVGHVDLIYGIAGRILFGRTTQREQPDLVAREVARIKERDPQMLYRAVRAVFDRESIHERLPAIRCPTLVLIGGEDQATPFRRSERIAASIVGASLRVIPRAGHLSALEAPAAVLREVGSFLTPIYS